MRMYFIGFTTWTKLWWRCYERKSQFRPSKILEFLISPELRFETADSMAFFHFRQDLSKNGGSYKLFLRISHFNDFAKYQSAVPLNGTNLDSARSMFSFSIMKVVVTI